MRQTYGPICHLIKLNSLRHGDDGLSDPFNIGLTRSDQTSVQDIWAPFLRETQRLNNARIALLSTSPSSASLSISGPSPTTEDGFPIYKEKISTVSSQSSDLVGDGEFMVTSAGIARHGAYVTESELKGAENFIKEFLTHGLIPYMEQKITGWNEQVR